MFSVLFYSAFELVRIDHPKAALPAAYVNMTMALKSQRLRVSVAP